MFLGRTEHLHYTSKLLLFIFSRENGIPAVELRQDTPQTPHINRHAVRHAKNDLWRAVKTTLDIGIHFLILETTGPKIDDPDFGAHGMNEKDILGFEVTMNNLLGVQECQSAQDLLREAAYKFE